MREIKFRAWNKRIGWKNKDGSNCEPVMEYKDFLIYPETGLCEFPQGGWDLGGYTEKPENFILMQFTGLKDKNGVEIYEGDILSFPQEKQIISVTWEMTRAGWQFDEHRGFDDGVGRGNWDFTMGIAKYSEVIGNIHENPELLTRT